MRAGQGWTPIPATEAGEWNRRLLATDGHLHQFPYWNEPLRYIHLAPQYLVYRSNGVEQVFVALLRIGVPFFRIGLIKGGPVSLIPGQDVSDEALRALYAWSRRAGYVFLRFSHADPAFSARIASLGNAERVDGFPVYPPLEFDLVIEQTDDDAQMLASFQRIARRNIRDASAVGYDIKITDDPRALVESWPLFVALGEKKGVRIYNRPMESYVRMVRLAKDHDAVRIYMAYLNGKLAETIVVVRDGSTAHYVAGALDTAVLGDRQNASPTTLLHWKAMRDFYRAGVATYSLGFTSYTFKEKFRPVRRDFPAPVTVAVNPLLYRWWVKMAPMIQRHGAALRESVSKVFSRRSAG